MDTSFPDGENEDRYVMGQRAVCRELYRQIDGKRGDWPDEVVDFLLPRIVGLVPAIDAPAAPLDVTPVVAEAPAEVAPALETKRTAESQAAQIVAEAQAQAAAIVAAAQADAAAIEAKLLGTVAEAVAP